LLFSSYSSTFVASDQQKSKEIANAAKTEL